MQEYVWRIANKGLCPWTQHAVSLVNYFPVFCTLQVDGKELPSEIALLKRTSGHRNIVGLHDFDITGEIVVMVLERPSPVLDGLGYLKRPRLQKSTEKVAKLVIRQVIDAVMHCLSVGVSHGDIKEENLLLELNTGRVVLIDFGLAEEIKNGQVNTLLGRWFVLLSRV